MQLVKTLIAVLALSLAALAGTCPSGVPSGVTACFYISSAGSDSATGADEAHPWAHAPGMVTCASNCAANTPSAGRGYIFRGGNTWASTNFNLVVSWSGSSGAPIYYGVDPLWFSGGSWARPIFNGGGTHLASGDSIITISNRNWITIDNLELTNLNAYDNFGPANIQLSCDTNVLMSNLYVHNWALDATVSTDDAHGGIFANNPSCDPVGVVIDHSVISNSEHTGSRQNGVAIRAIDMQYSVLHDVSTAQLFGRLHDSLIYNVSYPSGNQTFDNTYHTNVTYLAEWAGNGVRPTTNAYIYNNVIHDFAAGSGGLYPNECTGSVAFYMWNNVIYNNFSGNANIQIEPYGGSSGCGAWYVWNNTLQVPVGGGTNAIRIVPRGFSVGTVKLQNIHYVSDSGTFNAGDGVNSLTNANNVSQNNATANGQGFTGSQTYVYSPVSGAVSTIGTGVDLTSNCSGSLAGLCTDTAYGVGLNASTHSVVPAPRTTVSRPSGSAWDVGAYQFTSGGSGGANFPYGSNCSGSCGIGSGIITSSINIYLYDSNALNPKIQASTSINAYTPSSFPSTLDPTKMVVEWDSTGSGSGCVVLGVLLNTSNAVYCDVTGVGGTYNIGNHHKVILEHIVPANSNGTGGGPTTFYIGTNTDATPTNPGGSILTPNYGNGWSTYPGPQCINSGRACYFNVYFPNPGANLPLQWELTSPGQMSATQGSAGGAVSSTTIPLMLLWKNGNAKTTDGTAGLGPCTSSQLNYVGHLYNAASTPYSAPNSGSWYKCNGSSWTLSGTSPVFVWAATITKGANTYTCPGDVNGGVNPTTHLPSSTCTGSAGDSGISVTPYYAGTYLSGSPSTDYRQINYNASLGKYYFDMNGAAPPLNPQPTSVVSFFPGPTSITGAMTLNLTGTLYTDATMTAVAAGTTPVTLTYPITVSAPSTLAASAPTPSVDANLPAYFAYNATAAVNMASVPGATCGLAWWEQTISSTQWFPFGAGTFAECNTWNYDNSRVFTSASDQFTHKMDGTAWPTSWTGAHTYGDNYADEEICPNSDANGNCWVATNSTCLTGGSCGFTSGGSEPSWSTHGTQGATIADGGGSWINAGNRTYWNRAVNNSVQPYLNNLVLTGGAVSQFSQFTGGLDKNRQRTGDALAKSGTTVTGLYATGEHLAIFGDYGGGVFNPFSTNAGRGAAYELDTLLTDWRRACQQGNCGAFTTAGNMRLMQYDYNSTLNYWDFFIHQPQFSTNPVLAYGPVIIPFYVGLGTEAVIELIATCDELDPSKVQPICQDTRGIPALKAITGYMWQNWWNGTQKAGEGVSNYSFSYDPRDIQTHLIQEPFYTELTGPLEPAYDWLYAYCGGDNVNCVLPDGNHFDTAADQIRMHQFDGRNCNNWTCTGGSHYFGHPWSGGTGSPKMFGQANKWGLGNSYNWRLGFSAPLETDLTPSRNPCWDSGTIPCVGSHPYPDTQGPYMFQIINPGSSGQDDPGAEGHFTGRTDSPIYSFDSTSAKIQFWTYEATVGCSVSYGANPTCNAGSVSTEDAGYPQSQSLSGVSTYLHHFTATGLTPNTNYFVKMTCRDAAGNTFSNSCSQQSQQGGGINFTTLNQTVLTVLTTSLPNGPLNVAYSATLQAGGGTPAYTWAVGSLPTGLSLNASTGVISGTPTVAGTSSFTVQVTDSLSAHASQPLSITITNLTITTTSLANGTKNVAYSQTLTATGGTLPYTWTHILGILPTGLSLNASTGVISGTPVVCNAFPVTWRVTDSEVPTVNAAKPLTITITGCTGAVSITTVLPLHNCVVNVVCPDQTETATGGVAPYTWAVTSGALPTGMTLDSSTGILGGTPTVTGAFSFGVTATDSGSLDSPESPQSITVISTSQLGVTMNGNIKVTGNATIGTPNP